MTTQLNCSVISSQTKKQWNKSRRSWCRNMLHSAANWHQQESSDETFVLNRSHSPSYKQLHIIIKRPS